MWPGSNVLWSLQVGSTPPQTRGLRAQGKSSPRTSKVSSRFVPYLYQQAVGLVLFILAVLLGVKCCLIDGFNSHPFVCLSSSTTSLVLKCPNFLAHENKLECSSFYYWSVGFFTYYRYKSLVTCVINIFPQPVGCLFILLMVSFEKHIF